MSCKVYNFLLTFLFLAVVWAQIDKSCKQVRCITGFKCESGKCVRKQTYKKYCPLNYGMRIKCTGFERYNKCDKSKLIASCGITAQGIKKDFIDDCSPCLDKTVNQFFRVPCIKAPKICAEDEECVNEECINLNISKIQKDRQSCDTIKDCKKRGYTCASNKCVKLNEVVSALRQLNLSKPNKHD